VPATTPKKVIAPALRSNSAPVVTDAALVRAVPAPAAPTEPDTPPEEIHGNLYINHANHFSIYKAPSWNLIEDARKALPNAIVAMGTQNESTLLVVGKEKTGKQALELVSAKFTKITAKSPAAPPPSTANPAWNTVSAA
jgi:hypothetical protein